MSLLLRFFAVVVLMALGACHAPPVQDYPSVGAVSSLDEIKNSKGMMLVDFYADWCVPCRYQAPVIAEVEERVGDKAQVLKVDTDAQQEIANAYRIEGLPTLIVFKDGVEVQRMKGLQRDADRLVELLLR